MTETMNSIVPSQEALLCVASRDIDSGAAWFVPKQQLYVITLVPG